jgi:S-adenosylmethionine hydrolase
VTAPAITASGVITLLTDFGLADPFVGVMTGAIISRFPAARQIPLGRTYSEALPGHLLALLNSFGVLEVAEREGSAQRRLGLSRGAPVELVLDAPTAATAATDARS